MKNVKDEIIDKTTCEVHFDAPHRRVYSVDASIFEIEPLGVVIPKTQKDLLDAVKILLENEIPITPRGAATGITGGCLGQGVVIDLSKYLNKIIEINKDAGYAICEPGVIQDQLNNEVAQWNLRLGPDTSTGDRATIGGMTANNAAGSRSLRYGAMVDHILEIEMILSSGEKHWFGEISREQLPHSLATIRDTYRDEVQNKLPKIPRRSSGYKLDQLYHEKINLAKLITGSEGTLGVMSHIKVKLSPKPAQCGLCVIHFHSMHEAMQVIPQLLEWDLLALEMIDEHILELGSESPSLKGKLNWINGTPNTLFIAEFDDPSYENLQERLQAFAQEMTASKIGYATSIITNPEIMKTVWNVRKSGLGILLSKRSYSRAIAFIEDFSVPPEKLPPFMEKFCAYLKSKNKEAGIYGHVGPGCMHVRPFMDLREPSESDLMKTIMIDVAGMLSEHGGSLSGEHGDGLIRSWLYPQFFGPKLYQAFCDLKHAFDPKNLMNPGKIVNAPPVTQNMRMDPQTQIHNFDTFMDWSREGGLALAADLCNGNGLCRKTDGVMCPSFQATGDEFDSTRARAQVLRAVIHGKMKVNNLASDDVHDVLDLCLQCKGCKTECPSQVDMAKMKSEALFHYQQKNGYSLRTRIFGNIHKLLHYGSLSPTLFNAIMQSSLARYLNQKLGIAQERSFPQLAHQRFSGWFKSHHQPDTLIEPVVLFIDTFTEFVEPEIGKAAVKVLNSMGFRVIAPNWTCCGRPALTKGMLIQAQKQAENVLSTLLPFVKQTIPIIGLEPSCIMTILDEYRDLLPPSPLPGWVQTFDQFVEKHLNRLTLTKSITSIQVHEHCHQKSLVGTHALMNILNAIPNTKVSLINSGCCGMAGSFGYEAEHFDISMKIGSLHLFPAIDAHPKAVIVANGISCRTQIIDGTTRRALHCAEVLATSI